MRGGLQEEEEREEQEEQEEVQEEEQEEQEEREEGLFKANAVYEEDPKRDHATPGSHPGSFYIANATTEELKPDVLSQSKSSNFCVLFNPFSRCETRSNARALSLSTLFSLYRGSEAGKWSWQSVI